MRLKDTQKAKVFETILSKSGISRKNLANTLQFRPIDITRYVTELVEDGLVLEERKKPIGRGRPEIIIHPEPNRVLAIAIMVLSRQIKGVLLTLDNQEIYTTSRYLVEEATSEEIYTTLADIIDHLSGKISPPSTLCGIGFSLSGLIDRENTLWKHSNRWPSINNINLSKIGDPLACGSIENSREESTTAPIPVTLEKNISARLKGLLTKHKEIQSQRVVLIHWGWTIKMVYSHDGTIYDNSLGYFGDLGHSTVNPSSNRVCVCNQKGCLETEAALWYLFPELQRVIPDLSNDEEQFRAIFQATPYGEDIKRIMDKSCQAMAVTLKNISHILAPDTIYVYGPFSEKKEVFSNLQERFFAITPGAKEDTQLLQLSGGGFMELAIGCTTDSFQRELNTLLLARF